MWEFCWQSLRYVPPPSPQQAAVILSWADTALHTALQCSNQTAGLVSLPSVVKLLLSHPVKKRKCPVLQLVKARSNRRYFCVTSLWQRSPLFPGRSRAAAAVVKVKLTAPLCSAAATPRPPPWTERMTKCRTSRERRRVPVNYTVRTPHPHCSPHCLHRPNGQKYSRNMRVKISVDIFP